ncbi:FG-GAP-like repeat-containing protein [Streptomyces coeruleorubidus]|uniref:FG-GAP-like repeat-containing protein n=1 Tax=Streptomyces coeruleorubidus TaxID=116188 RepID=UPI00237F1F56|nr:FG-GAP-like repeat-containing protein [Streptomyces coeruleorubidus]WDV52855.1 FG-GAP-like repeat-containing protein [Streptomyces coeruleorubidus]
MATAVALAALTGGLLVPTVAGSAFAATGDRASVSGRYGDFNGDGRVDLAASAPDATVDGTAGAGAVTIAYGSADGAGATQAERVTISQNSKGVGGQAEAGDHFGFSVAIADFDNDGFADLATGTPGEDVGDDQDAGIVQILWGSPTGLSSSARLADPTSSDQDAHGRTLAAGDFNGDGKDDLAAGNTSAQAWLYAGGIARDGADSGTHPLGNLNAWGGEVVALTAGDVTGDGADDLLFNHYQLYRSGGDASTLGLDPRAMQVGYMGGYSSVFGDFNNDGYGDIVLGRPGDHGGEITYVLGRPVSDTDPTWTLDDNRHTLDQGNFDTPGENGLYDRYGAGLAAGDINGDGYDDLAVGDPNEDTDSGTVADAGHVTVMYGGSIGPTTTNRQVFDQGTEGVPGENEAGDGFGSRLLLSDLDGDGRKDLTIAALGEDGGSGALTTLLGTDITLTVTGARSLTPTSYLLSTDGQPQLGSSLQGHPPITPRPLPEVG